MRKLLISFLIISIIILSILFSVILPTLVKDRLRLMWDRELEILEITTNLSLNFSEVKQIDITYAERELKQIGLEFKDISNRTPNKYDYYIAYYIFLPSNISYNRLNIGIVAYITNNTEISYMSIRYYPPNSKSSELESEKQYLIEKANEVAEICDLTIDWNKAEWSVSYYDD